MPASRNESIAVICIRTCTGSRSRDRRQGFVSSRVLRLVGAFWLAGALMTLSGCGWFADRWEWNQRLTVEVLVDGELVSGSAVSHVWWEEANSLGFYPAGYNGEATVVDLGGGRYLFALIGEDSKYIAQFTLHNELGEDRGDYGRLLPKVARFRGTREVSPKNYPALIAFRDLNDPKTMLRLVPNQLATTFGPGVSLKRITLEITDENVTRRPISKLLPWLDHLEDFESRPGNPFSSTLPQGVGGLRKGST